MPAGKPAGVPCVHLGPDFSCLIFHSPDRPRVCAAFRPEASVCGTSRKEALLLLSALE